MKTRIKVWKIFNLLVLVSALWPGLSACVPTTPNVESVTASPIPLTTYPTATTTPITEIENNPDEGQEQPIIQEPTITPFLYTIQSGDMLSGVAQRHGVKLEQLLAANPEIDPNFLIVGTEIIISTGDGEIATFPTPTPIAVMLGTPICYATADHGASCLVLAENQQPQDLENISATIRLLTREGDPIHEELAISPLNLLSSGNTISLIATFPGPIPEGFRPQAILNTALPISPDDKRYIDLEISIEDQLINGISARVRGKVINANVDEPLTAQVIWLAAIAYDDAQQPIGIRKLEMETELLPENSLPFEINVYSLGPSIANVIILGEARP